MNITDLSVKPFIDVYDYSNQSNLNIKNAD